VAATVAPGFSLSISFCDKPAFVRSCTDLYGRTLTPLMSSAEHPVRSRGDDQQE
jgi:hypothetical protein